MENINGAIKDLIKNDQIMRWKIGMTYSGKGTKNQKDDLFIPNLVSFLIQIIIMSDMSHSHISKKWPSKSIHIWSYINNHACKCNCTLGLEKTKVFNTKTSILTEYTIWVICILLEIIPEEVLHCCYSEERVHILQKIHQQYPYFGVCVIIV